MMSAKIICSATADASTKRRASMCERYNCRSNNARVVRSKPALKERPRSAYLARVPEVRASVAFRSRSSGVGRGALLARVLAIHGKLAAPAHTSRFRQVRVGRGVEVAALGQKNSAVALATGSGQKPRDRM